MKGQPLPTLTELPQVSKHGNLIKYISDVLLRKTSNKKTTPMHKEGEHTESCEAMFARFMVWQKKSHDQ